jgi:hypothetical protein
MVNVMKSDSRVERRIKADLKEIKHFKGFQVVLQRTWEVIEINTINAVTLNVTHVNCPGGSGISPRARVQPRSVFRLHGELPTPLYELSLLILISSSALSEHTTHHSKMVANTLIYHPALAHWLRFTATTGT